MLEDNKTLANFLVDPIVQHVYTTACGTAKVKLIRYVAVDLRVE